jgi:hypothetical protein
MNWLYQQIQSIVPDYTECFEMIKNNCLIKFAGAGIRFYNSDQENNSWQGGVMRLRQPWNFRWIDHELQ